MRDMIAPLRLFDQRQKRLADSPLVLACAAVYVFSEAFHCSVSELI